MQQQKQINRIWIRAVQCTLLGIGAPLGWLVFRAISGADPMIELTEHRYLYLYMLIPTMVAFATLGSLMGRYEEGLRKANYMLDELSVTDPATGLKNHRYFLARFSEEFAKAQRNTEPLALLLLDLDNFKKVNDKHGTHVGESALESVAQAIMSVMRQEETAARVGGEEFAMILPKATEEQAHTVAERVHAAVKAAVVEGAENEVVRLSASIGVASTAQSEQMTQKELYMAADTAMYKAKDQGRDRVAVFQTEWH